jgi:hypothetical protein
VRPPTATGAYRTGTIVFGIVAIGLGIAITIVTAANGGGVGLLVGPLFVALGAGRLSLLRRT